MIITMMPQVQQLGCGGGDWEGRLHLGLGGRQGPNCLVHSGPHMRTSTRRDLVYLKPKIK